jgi:hypothetical protein
LANTTTIKVKILGDEKDASSALDRFSKKVKDVDKGLASFGKTAFKNVGSGIAGALTSTMSALPGFLSPQGIAIGGGIAAAIAAGVGVASPLIAGAVVAGLGAGVIAGGIKLAAKDPAVKSAWKEFKEKVFTSDTADQEKKVADAQKKYDKLLADAREEALKKQKKNMTAGEREINRLRAVERKKGIDEAKADLLKQQAELQRIQQNNKKAFSLEEASQSFVGPVIEALDKIGLWFQKHGNDFQKMFDTMAPVIGPVTDNLLKMAENALPGLQTALEASAPIIEEMSNHLPALGTAIGNFLKVASRPEVVSAMGLAMHGLVGAVIVLTDALDRGISIFRLLVTVGTESAIGILTAMQTMVIGIRNSFGQIIHGAALAFGWIPGLGQSLKGSDRAFQEWSQSAVDSMDDMITDLQGLHDGVNRVPGSKTTTFKGDTKGIVQGAGGARTAITSVPAFKVSFFRGNVKALDDAAYKARDAQNRVPGNKVTRFNGDTGPLSRAKDRVNNILDNIRKSITVTIKGVTSGFNIPFIGGRAMGGPVNAGQPYVVGEKRPELFVPGQNGTILPSVPRAFSGGGPGGGGYAPMIVNVYVAGSVTSENDLADSLEKKLTARQYRTNRINGRPN